jgi:hypothetical protein
MYAYGHDFGNSETCGVFLCPGQRQERRIPSVTAIGNWQRYVNTVQGSGQENVQVQPNHYILEYDAMDDAGNMRRVEKIIGQKVFDDGEKPLQTLGDSSRYWVNGYNLEMLLTGLGSITSYPEFGAYVVTGLPISGYLDDPANKELVKNALVGNHRFWLNGRERVAHIVDVMCIMEGAGALIAYGSTGDVLQGVIDIGGHTTDLFCATGQKPRPAQCKGVSLGVASAADRLEEKFREHFGFTPSLETVKKLMSNYVNARPLPTVREKKRQNAIAPETLSGLIDMALREVGQEIATSVMRAWDSEVQEMEEIRIVGGGAHYFTRYIQERIGHAKAAHRPEMANAEGYAALAERRLQRAIGAR